MGKYIKKKKMQSVKGEALMVAITLIKNAEWQSYKGKSSCDTLLPPISVI